MKMSSTAAAALAIALGLIFMNFTGQCHGALLVGFYRGKCKRSDVEQIVAGVVSSRFFRDRSIVPALIRLQFHDCFVKGCDASILLDGDASEKNAGPNLSVRGYDIIDMAKAAVDRICPGVVSCADIIAMATRDAVFWGGGGHYNVQTGRRDGTESLADNVDLPGPSISVSDSLAAFAAKGLDATDMVLLLGGHSVGIAHCSFFEDRLYNFQNTGRPDPTMNSTLANRLRQRCPQLTPFDNAVDLDQNPASGLRVDNTFYQQIRTGRGILQIDQDLALDPLTRDMVTMLANDPNFRSKFGQAMMKLGAVGVLTGTQGEIRRTCRAVKGPKRFN